VSDIDIAVADSLKVLDLKRPIREADISHTTTPAEIFENDPRRTLVGPCGRLVNFHDRLACLDLLADAVTHDSNFVF
jgi:succinate dehydrogenase/fumarate reductase-like Fe-S protein